jgi:hypothetical protein
MIASYIFRTGRSKIFLAEPGANRMPKTETVQIFHELTAYWTGYFKRKRRGITVFFGAKRNKMEKSRGVKNFSYKGAVLDHLRVRSGIIKPFTPWEYKVLRIFYTHHSYALSFLCIIFMRSSQFFPPGRFPCFIYQYNMITPTQPPPQGQCHEVKHAGN